jgi:Kdo2-lipid IVA lauroyltransferase/acyltransferase
VTRARALGGVPRTPLDAIDRRTGGAWTRRQRAKNFLIAAAVRAALATVDRLPAAALLGLGRVAGLLASRLLRGARRAATRSASHWFSREDADRVGRACLARAGQNLATILLLRREGVRARDWVHVSPEVEEALGAVLARGRGAVFVSAHLGPFELVAARIAELGHRPAVVVRESYDPRLDDWVDAHRLGRGIEVIHRGAARSGLRMVRAIREGRPLGLLPDLGGRVPSIPVSFLGTERSLPTGPQELALRLGAPLLVGTLVRRQGAPRGTPCFALQLEELALDADVATLTQRVAARLTAAIVASPEDWLWMAGSRTDAQRGMRGQSIDCGPIPDNARLVGYLTGRGQRDARGPGQDPPDT